MVTQNQLPNYKTIVQMCHQQNQQVFKQQIHIFQTIIHEPNNRWSWSALTLIGWCGLQLSHKLETATATAMGEGRRRRQGRRATATAKGYGDGDGRRRLRRGREQEEEGGGGGDDNGEKRGCWWEVGVNGFLTKVAKILILNCTLILTSLRVIW